ncbi:MAG TPA: uracil-DNA glycosylase [Bacteroidota bacterium]|nr:uracil-DNA glycosylase [Bacteroidota bacterium]
MKSHRPQLDLLQSEIVQCAKCPRLVKWREKVARTKTARYSDWEYWGKPVPGFGDPDARVLIVGLAPGAHGANRTGRMFTGDSSGNWLYLTLHKFGFSSRLLSLSRDDGMKLKDCYITAALRCAPPANKPTSGELHNCSPFFLDELRILFNIRIIVALGKVAFDTVFDAYRELHMTTLSKRPEFRHGAEIQLNYRQVLIASYHPSQQNTFTGKLTHAMFDAVFGRVKKILATKRKPVSSV